MLDLLLNAQRNTAAAATVPALNEHAIKLLVQGQVVRLLAQSPVAVTPGSILQLQWSPASGMKILRIDPPSEIPPSVRSFVGKAMSAQGSPGPLLQTLQTILTRTGPLQAGPTVSATLPENVQAVARQVLALFPNNATITRPGVLESFVTRSSGLFLEASLASALRLALGQPISLTTESNPAATATSTTATQAEPGDAGVAGKALLRMLGQLRDHLRSGVSDVKVTGHATEPEASPSDESQKAPGETASNSNRSTFSRATVAIPNDFKSLLLQLHQQLNAARSTPSPQGGVSASMPSSALMPTSGAMPNSTSIPISASMHSNTPPSATPTTTIPQSPVSAPATVVTKDAPAGVDVTVNSTGTAVKNDSGASMGTPATMKSAAAGEAGKIPSTSADETTSPTPASQPATTNPRYSRLARAADQYQRLEQMTRPTQSRPSSAGATPSAQHHDALDLAAQWADMATDIDFSEIDIPGLGLPLPHRQKPRNDPAGDSLDNLLGLLLKRTQESLNRLHLHQLSHAGTTTREAGTQQQNPPLTFDLPVFFDGQVQMFNTRIDEEELPAGENAQNGQKVKQWSVSLGFDIEGLGPMFCQLQMTTHHANLQFWADRPATLALTRNNIDFLSKSLNDLGVSVSEVSCHEGLPKQTRTRLSQQLVDVNT